MQIITEMVTQQSRKFPIGSDQDVMKSRVIGGKIFYHYIKE